MSPLGPPLCFHSPGRVSEGGVEGPSRRSLLGVPGWVEPRLPDGVPGGESEQWECEDYLPEVIVHVLQLVLGLLFSVECYLTLPPQFPRGITDCFTNVFRPRMIIIYHRLIYSYLFLPVFVNGGIRRTFLFLVSPPSLDIPVSSCPSVTLVFVPNTTPLPFVLDSPLRVPRIVGPPL